MRLLWGNLCSPVFWIAVFLNSYFIFQASDLGFFDTYDLIYSLGYAYFYSIASHLTPVLVSVISIMRFHDELENGIYRAEIMRIGKVRFSALKIWDAFLSGVEVMLFSLLAYTLIVFVCGGINGIPVTMENADDFTDYSDLSKTNLCRELILNGKGFLVYLLKCVCVTLYGSVWAAMGGVLAFFINNKRVVILGPFILKALLEYLAAYSEFKWGISIFVLHRLQQPLSGATYLICCPAVILLLCTVIVYVRMEQLCRKKG